MAQLALRAYLSFQSHAGSIEALRFQGVSGGREREPPSEIQFALNIASVVRFVKGCGFSIGLSSFLGLGPSCGGP
jgi:hypothetical protein